MCTVELPVPSCCERCLTRCPAAGAQVPSPGSARGKAEAEAEGQGFPGAPVAEKCGATAQAGSAPDGR